MEGNVLVNNVTAFKYPIARRSRHDDAALRPSIEERRTFSRNNHAIRSLHLFLSDLADQNPLVTWLNFPLRSFGKRYGAAAFFRFHRFPRFMNPNSPPSVSFRQTSNCFSSGSLCNL